MRTVDARGEHESEQRKRPAGWMTAEQLHRTLAAFNRERLTPCLPAVDAAEALTRENTLCRLEAAFLAAERTRVAPQLQEVPTRPGPFLEWFLALREGGPEDPLFGYLAQHASLQELRWFLLQEVAADASCDELAALARLRMAARPRPEGARPRAGEAWSARGARLTAVAEALDLRPTSDNTVWETAALGNLVAGLAWNRHYAFQAMGALAVVELTAPSRAALVDEGLQRLGVPGSVRGEGAVDPAAALRAARGWCQQALLPLLREHPDVCRAVAEGALMRMAAASRCFERYRHELGLAGEPPRTLH